MRSKWWYLFILAAMGSLAACNPEPIVPTDPDINEVNTGKVEFNFPLPPTEIPKKGIHRVDLSLALSADSLYRHEFYRMGNVSDYALVYTFILGPGKYFYQAGITCSCGGDTCLWNNFPGGQYGIKWTMGWFTVEKGKTTMERITFD